MYGFRYVISYIVGSVSKNFTNNYIKHVKVQGRVKTPLNTILGRAQEGNPNIEKDPSVIYVSKNDWKDQPSLQCYECNSEYDPSCGDPFNNYSIGVVNCSVKKAPEHLVRHDTHPGETIRPTVCRKIVQKSR